MTATVFASAGSRKYHFDKGCSAFHSAQLLSDADCGCDTYCTHRMPRMHGLVRMSATKAAMDSKLPCLACVPPHLREMPEVEDFGHRSIVSFVDGRALNRVCARCTTNTPTGVWGVRWPCTSALVLGLVEREEARR